MKVQFSKIERTAGLFVLVAVGALFFFTAVVAIKQGWFMPKQHYTTKFVHGEGLHPGTLVQISGLRAGRVESVTLNDSNLIEVGMSVSHEFSKRVRKDSVARMIRPFIIGDKVVEITVGTPEMELIKEGAEISGEDTMDLMDLVGGGRLGPYLTTLHGLLKNLEIVFQAFTEPKRSEALIKMFDEALPTIQGLNELSQQITRNKNLDKSMENFSLLSRDMRQMTPAMLEFSKKLPELSETTAKTMSELSLLTVELNKLVPVLAQLAPQLPEASQKGIETLKEAVIVLRAMQKSFLLRGAVEDVKEEDAKKERLPASEKNDSER